MIYIFMVFFLIIGVGGILCYVLDVVGTEVLDMYQAAYPSLFTGPPVDFLRAIFHWMPFFVVLAGLLYVFVASQRGAEPEGYYP